jgi:polyisoprenoid-binding protein YceI
MKHFKLTLVSFVSLVMLAFTAYAATMKWGLDKNHSNVSFLVEHMEISEVTGEFEKYEASIKTNGQDNFESAEVMVEIDASSVNTDNKKRDKHLRGEDFFNVKKYPKITFKADGMDKMGKTEDGNTKYKLAGKLTMHGKTRKETFTAIHNGTVKDPFSKKPKAGWEIRGTVNRYDYGLKWDKTTEAGNLIVGKKVDIVCDIEISPAS